MSVQDMEMLKEPSLFHDTNEIPTGFSFFCIIVVKHEKYISGWQREAFVFKNVFNHLLFELDEKIRCWVR